MGQKAINQALSNIGAGCQAMLEEARIRIAISSG
jgi:hypothetical protein